MPQSQIPHRTLRFACYVRVSSASQHGDGQRSEIKRWLEGNGMEPNAVRWFEEQESGSNLERPAFAALQKAIFMGEIKTVVVWRLDRLSRNQKDGINTLAEWCERGVRVVSVTQQLDLSGATGRLIAGVLFAVAEMELEAIKERQAIGIAAAKERGVYKNNGLRRKGYRKADAKRVVALRKDGVPAATISRDLGIARSTVYAYLKDADYNTAS
ncbi:recombinase family protein [Stieleria sp. TO1_6]|nr:recombinase family protein [Stieleria tagensis]